ncbi:MULTISPECIES: hypothetical protein [Deinococcus]|uniref:hypothetical protein n=1 Tax=Deinococcus TaxID=1298 RepID=UPI0004839379|nr:MULTISPECIES: hypothetical protein [Deinococcus]KEF34030.1 hypothetical protein RDMS_09220 [Deinococcus sp. RL]
MKPDLWRWALGALGLTIGFAVYPLLGRLPGPWPDLLAGAVFVALGAAAWRSASGDRFVQGVALLLALYGLARMLFLR